MTTQPEIFTLTQQEGQDVFARLNERVVRTISTGPVFWGAYLVVLLIPVVFVLFYQFTKHGDVSKDDFITAAFVSYAAGVAVTMFAYYLIQFNSKNILLPRSTQLWAEQKVKISIDGINLETEHAKTSFSWSNLGPVEWENNILMIYSGDCCAIFIPDRAFPTNENSQAFESLCRQHAFIKS